MTCGSKETNTYEIVYKIFKTLETLVDPLVTKKLKIRTI